MRVNLSQQILAVTVYICHQHSVSFSIFSLYCSILFHSFIQTRHHFKYCSTFVKETVTLCQPWLYTSSLKSRVFSFITSLQIHYRNLFRSKPCTVRIVVGRWRLTRCCVDVAIPKIDEDDNMFYVVYDTDVK